jgi:hypothetical protein
VARPYTASLFKAIDSHHLVYKKDRGTSKSELGCIAHPQLDEPDKALRPTVSGKGVARCDTCFGAGYASTWRKESSITKLSGVLSSATLVSLLVEPVGHAAKEALPVSASMYFENEGVILFICNICVRYENKEIYTYLCSTIIKFRGYFL